MNYSDIIVVRIAEIIKKKSISVNKLAEMSGVAQSTLDNIMHGASKNPTLKTIHKIANALGLTVSEFLDYKGMNEFSFDEGKTKDD